MASAVSGVSDVPHLLSSLGPYDGGLHFGHDVTTDSVKAASFDALCSNALAGPVGTRSLFMVVWTAGTLVMV